MKTITEDSPLYTVNEDLTTFTRCSVEIANECPEHIAKAIMTAWHYGYLKCSANFTDREYSLLGLSNEN